MRIFTQDEEASTPSHSLPRQDGDPAAAQRVVETESSKTPLCVRNEWDEV